MTEREALFEMIRQADPVPDPKVAAENLDAASILLATVDDKVRGVVERRPLPRDARAHTRIRAQSPIAPGAEGAAQHREPGIRRAAMQRAAPVAAAVVLLVGVGIGAAWLAGAWRHEATPVVDRPTVPSITPSPPQPTPGTGGGASFTLVADHDVDPVRVSTVLGEMEFATFRFPSGQDFLYGSGWMATAHGPIALDGATLWWSADYETWQSLPIGVDGGGTTTIGTDILVVFVPGNSVPGGAGAVWFGWEAGGWTPLWDMEMAGARDPGGFVEWIDNLTAGPRGMVAWGSRNVYYSTDGVTFAEAESGPDLEVFAAAEENPAEAEYPEAARMDCRSTFGATGSRIRSVLAIDAGFVAVTSAVSAGETEWACEPYLWFSADGNTWELVAPRSPFGELSAVAAIAEHDGRFVAHGYQGSEEAPGNVALWVSEDALTWRRVEMGLRGVLTLDSGDLGWVLTGFADPDPDVLQMWVSTDGRVWDGPHDLPDGLLSGYIVPELVVGSDTILGVGFDAQVHVIGRLHEGD